MQFLAGYWREPSYERGALQAACATLGFDVEFDRNPVPRSGEVALTVNQSVSLFPLSRVVHDKREGIAVGLVGYAWDRSHFARSEEEASQFVLRTARRILAGEDFPDLDSDGGLFNVVAYSQSNQKIVLANDPSGVLPLFYNWDGQTFSFCSHIRPLALAARRRLDVVGLVEHGALHYTIGERTLFDGIARLRPGERVVFNLNSRKLHRAQRGDCYSKIIDAKNCNIVNNLWQAFLSGIEPFSKIDKTIGLLTSGGFDTRLLQRGFMELGVSTVGVTMGDPSNAEVAIARKAATISGSIVEAHTPGPEFDLDDAEISLLVRLAETVNFPNVSAAVQILRGMGAVASATGFGGETFLGGQAFTPLGRRWSMRARLVFALRRSAGSKLGFQTPVNSRELQAFKDTLSDHIRKAVQKRITIFSGDVLSCCSRLEEEILDDIEKELARISGTSQFVEQICERFWLEHHVLRHFGQQEATIGVCMPVFLPTVHHSFFRICTNLNPAQKVDHGIYLKLVREKFGPLGNLPTSNIPVPVRWPDCVLWMARGARALYDRQQTWIQLKTKGRLGRRVGWSNFENWVRGGAFLDRVCCLVDSDLFDKEAIVRQVTRIKNWQERVYSAQDLLTVVSLSLILNTA